MSINNVTHKINICIFCAYIIVANTPILSSVTLEIAIAGVWIIFNLIYARKITLSWKLLIVIWLCYEILLRLINFSTSAWGNYAVHILYFFPVLVFGTYRTRISEKEKSFIWTVYFLSILLNVISNVFVLIRYPQYNLMLNYAEIYNGISLQKLNLGNTMFAYLIMLFALCCFYFVCFGRKKYIVPLILSVAYVFMSSKTTAMLLMLFGFLIIFQKKMANRIRRGQRIAIVAIGAVLIIIAIKVGLPLLANSIDNSYIQERLMAIANGDYGSEYFSRIELAMLSLKTFASHPFFGVGYELINLTSTGAYSTGIGHHSEIIDLLGRYGLIGAIFNVLIYFGFYKYVMKLDGDENDKSFGRILLLIVLIYSFLNNSIAVETGVFLFYIIPSICNGDIKLQLNSIRLETARGESNIL